MKLAEKLHVSRQAISRWEVGTAAPSTENLKELSALYDVSVDYLLGKDLSDDPAKKELLDLLSGMTAEQLKQFKEYAEYLISRR